MKTYYLYTQDNNDTFFKEINEFLDWIELEDTAQIYINSGGGLCWLFYTVARRLNRMVKEWYDITLRIIFAWSAAFNLAYLFEWKIEIEDWADWLVHITSTEIPMWKDVYRSNDSFDRARKEWRDKQPQIDFRFLTKKEKKEYLNGKDIWISPERMTTIFK